MRGERRDDGRRTIAVYLPALTLLALTLPALAGESAAAPANDTTVLLRPTAVVTGEQVLLSDVAELNGEAAQLAGSWPVAAAPHAGASGAIDAVHLQSVLSRRGVNLSNWIFRGASRCVVSKPAGTPLRPKAGPMAPANTNVPKLGTPAPVSTRPAGAQGLSDESVGPDPATLEGAIYARIRERLGTLTGALTVKFSPATARLLSLSTSHYQFRIADRGGKVLGLIPLEVTILEDGEVQQVVQVVCEATLRRPVVVAGRAINRGEIVQAADLRNELRAFDKIEEAGLVDAAPLVGQRARRLIRFGEQIATRDFEPVPLVERNDLVTVSVRRGGLTIIAAARALASAGYGETVSLRSELSKEVFVGLVTGPKTVELSEAGRPSSGGQDARPPGPAAASVAAAGGKY